MAAEVKYFSYLEV